jgi:hypothetical protein
LLNTPLGITPNGLIVFRSRIFGGMSAEVLTIFNQSSLPQKLKGTTFCKANPNSIFAHVRGADFKIVPPGGVPAGTKIAVADSAYARSTIDTEVPLYLPSKLPADGSNPKVRESKRFLRQLSFYLNRVQI